MQIIFSTLKKKTEVKKMTKNETIDSSYNGVLVVRAKNALFNAGFDGLPRTLPDGTIFATDKALKYCIREYLAKFDDKERVFVRRNRQINSKGDYVYDTLEENFENKTDLKLNSKLKNKEIINNLKKFIDVRLFGIVFSPSGKGINISFTGPVQISYGINKLKNSSAYSSDILSPYADKKPSQTTIGNESRTDEVYYVYDISVNKNNAVGKNGTGMTKKDLEVLKKSLMRGVDLVTSTTKFGVESSALIWIENNKNKILNNLSDFVKISKEEEKALIDISELKEYLKQEGIKDKNIEIETKTKKVDVKY